MGIFDKVFDIRIPCPNCGTAGAKVTLSGVKCVNPRCGNYDPSVAGGQPAAPAPVSATPIPATPIAAPPAPATFARPVTIAYTNHRGEGRRFTGDARSIRDQGLFLSVRVAPKGKRIALRKTKIANLSEVEAATRPGPGPHPSKREAHVLRYHSKRGTTSVLYQSLRAKYPGW